MKERLSDKQRAVVRLIALDRDPYHGVLADRNAIIGRSTTLESLKRRGIAIRTKPGLYFKWELTEKGKALDGEERTA